MAWIRTKATASAIIRGLCHTVYCIFQGGTVGLCRVAVVDVVWLGFIFTPGNCRRLHKRHHICLKLITRRWMLSIEKKNLLILFVDFVYHLHNINNFWGRFPIKLQSHLLSERDRR
jgi:hypothetical protein